MPGACMRATDESAGASDRTGMAQAVRRVQAQERVQTAGAQPPAVMRASQERHPVLVAFPERARGMRVLPASAGEQEAAVSREPVERVERQLSATPSSIRRLFSPVSRRRPFSARHLFGSSGPLRWTTRHAQKTPSTLFIRHVTFLPGGRRFRHCHLGG